MSVCDFNAISSVLYHTIFKLQATCDCGLALHLLRGELMSVRRRLSSGTTPASVGDSMDCGKVYAYEKLPHYLNFVLTNLSAVTNTIQHNYTIC